MKRGYKKKWLTALRSGKYKQGVGFLREIQPDGDKFCCLGVLCDVTKKGIWAEAIQGNYWRTKEGSISMLYQSNKDYGLPVEKMKHLWRMNDNERKSFLEIADWIETNVE